MSKSNIHDKPDKQQMGDTIRLIVRGTLGSCSSSSECKYSNISELAILGLSDYCGERSACTIKLPAALALPLVRTLTVQL